MYTFCSAMHLFFCNMSCLFRKTLKKFDEVMGLKPIEEELLVILIFLHTVPNKVRNPGNTHLLNQSVKTL